MEYLLILFFLLLFILDYTRTKPKRNTHIASKPKSSTSTKPITTRSVKQTINNPLPKPSTLGTTSLPKLYVNPIAKQAYLKSTEWHTKRKAVLKRDHYTCQKCGIDGISLEVHHLTYTNLYNEPLSDLVSVCRECHERQHQHYGFNHNTNFYPLV